MESLYWVFTLKCNDVCAHCYNNSGPRGESISVDELLKVVPNLPDTLGRVILSGGEPTVEMDKLDAIVRALKKRYEDRTPIYLQSNGDLLNDEKVTRLLDMGIDRIDIVSLDRFHKQKGAHVERIRALFDKHGLVDAGKPRLEATPEARRKEYAFWGANEMSWLGGNWARGRAVENKLALLDPNHNFCALWSGAKGFLDSGSAGQEVHIQLYRLYPCCPTTLFALGDVRDETVEALLDRHRGIPTFQLLNRGDAPHLGTESGLTPEYVQGRIEALGDVCRWCDEFFEKHYSGPRGERRADTLAIPPRAV